MEYGTQPQSLFDSIETWIKRPFDDDMDLVEWAALTVAITTIVYLWWRVLIGLYGEAD